MTLTIVGRFCKNGEVKLQYLDNGEAHENPLPLLIVPGATENAEDYLPFLQTLRRRVVALTLRGRYPSDAPASGYSVEDHAGDIAALVEHLALEHFALYAFSRGVSYALAYAVEHPERLEALLLGDYPPRHTALPTDWAERAWGDSWRGKTTPQRAPRLALEGMQRDSMARSFVDELPRISCRVLILRGNPDLGSLLDLENEQLYLTGCRRATVHRCPRSGHDIRFPEEDSLIQRIESFLA
jgi:pimeloyl-ACP methyl ester carboxylesterase